MAGSDEYLAHFEALHPKKIDLTLARTERLLAAMGNPERRLPPVIHVAGTNGKGSTIALIRAMLEASGASVHVYTSPHLVHFHERIRLGAPGGGQLVSEAQLVDAFERAERANAGEPITFFEITSVVAFDLFARNPADYLLLEVGLGGRGDTTNVIERPLASVITPVSFDHRDHLGETIPAIAGEKAGIIKRKCPVIIAEQDGEAVETCLTVAQRLGAPALVGGQDFQAYEERGRMVFQSADTLLDLPRPRLAGRHQILNAATAIATLLHVAPERATIAALSKGLETVEWPGRMQRLTGVLARILPAGTELWLDGAHNQDGARVLAEALVGLEEQVSRPLVLVGGILARKRADEVLAPFVGLAQELIAVELAGALALPAADFARESRRLGLPALVGGTIPEALESIAARPWPIAPRVVIMGSLHLAGEALTADGSTPR